MKHEKDNVLQIINRVPWGTYFCSIWNQILQNSQPFIDPLPPLLQNSHSHPSEFSSGARAILYLVCVTYNFWKNLLKFLYLPLHRGSEDQLLLRGWPLCRSSSSLNSYFLQNFRPRRCSCWSFACQHRHLCHHHHQCNPFCLPSWISLIPASVNDYYN